MTLFTGSDAWNAAGDSYREMAETLRPAAEEMIALLPVEFGMRVLDLACGTGLASFGAAARGALVTGIDFAPALIEEAVRQAHDSETTVAVSFDVGDVEQLPYPDQSFDAAISNFGMIFATKHLQVVQETARVLRPGGVLGFTAWLPQEPNLSLMTITSRYLPPPESEFGVFDWGCEDHIERLRSPHFQNLTLQYGNVPWRCASASEAIDMLLYRSLGPTMSAFRAADLNTKRRIHQDCIALFARCLEPDGSVQLDRHYVMVRAVKRSN